MPMSWTDLRTLTKHLATLVFEVAIIVFMPFYNADAANLDRKQTPNTVQFKIVDISDFWAVGTAPPDWNGKQAITLYSNPQQIQWALEARYAKSHGHLTSQANLTYLNTSQAPIRLEGILINTGCNMDAAPHLDALSKLTRSGLNSYAPVLALVFGSRQLFPVVMTQLSVTEDAWSNGFVSRAELSLEFETIQVPKKYVPPSEKPIKPTPRQTVLRAKAIAGDKSATRL